MRPAEGGQRGAVAEPRGQPLLTAALLKLGRGRAASLSRHFRFRFFKIYFYLKKKVFTESLLSNITKNTRHVSDTSNCKTSFRETGKSAFSVRDNGHSTSGLCLGPQVPSR